LTTVFIYDKIGLVGTSDGSPLFCLFCIKALKKLPAAKPLRAFLFNRLENIYVARECKPDDVAGYVER
jgi:hypothetical protein